MLSYTIASSKRLEGHPTRAYDVIYDIRDDLYGLSLTLLAISEQPSVIEGEQIATISELVGNMGEALAEVLELLRNDAGKAVA